MGIADEVREWLDASWDESITLREWWRRLADSGYAFPTWPVAIGGLGLAPVQAREVSEALAERGVIAPPDGMGPNMAVPTIMANGTPEQLARFARAVATGESQFCQLFSEPGAGSDLASLACRAARDGDELVVTGQKVWNSGAEWADKGMLLARTNPDMPKHRGLTYVIIDMCQPGVEVRPLVQMNRQAEFCEVFLTEARARIADVVGDIDNGWHVARTTLAAERSMAASGRSRSMVPVTGGPIAGNLDRTCAEIIADWRRASRDSRRRAAVLLSARAIIDLARDAGRTGDPVVRQDLADYWCRSEVYRLTNKRVGDNAKAGRVGPEGSIGKLGLAMLAHRSRDLSLRILGAGGMLMGPDAPGGGSVQMAGLSSHAPSIGGGTNEIQRTVIGEQALGLPREPSTDTDIPFKDLLRSGSRE